jgi:hypothetical protein
MSFLYVHVVHPLIQLHSNSISNVAQSSIKGANEPNWDSHADLSPVLKNLGHGNRAKIPQKKTTGDVPNKISLRFYSCRRRDFIIRAVGSVVGYSQQESKPLVLPSQDDFLKKPVHLPRDAFKKCDHILTNSIVKDDRKYTNTKCCELFTNLSINNIAKEEEEFRQYILGNTILLNIAQFLDCLIFSNNDAEILAGILGEIYNGDSPSSRQFSIGPNNDLKRTTQFETRWLVLFARFTAILVNDLVDAGGDLFESKEIREYKYSRMKGKAQLAEGKYTYYSEHFKRHLHVFAICVAGKMVLTFWYKVGLFCRDADAILQKVGEFDSLQSFEGCSGLSVLYSLRLAEHEVYLNSLSKMVLLFGRLYELSGKTPGGLSEEDYRDVLNNWDPRPCPMNQRSRDDTRDAFSCLVDAFHKANEVDWDSEDVKFVLSDPSPLLKRTNHQKKRKATASQSTLNKEAMPKKSPKKSRIHTGDGPSSSTWSRMGVSNSVSSELRLDVEDVDVEEEAEGSDKKSSEEMENSESESEEEDDSASMSVSKDDVVEEDDESVISNESHAQEEINKLFEKNTVEGEKEEVEEEQGEEEEQQGEEEEEGDEEETEEEQVEGGETGGVTGHVDDDEDTDENSDEEVENKKESKAMEEQFDYGEESEEEAVLEEVGKDGSSPNDAHVFKLLSQVPSSSPSSRSPAAPPGSAHMLSQGSGEYSSKATPLSQTIRADSSIPLLLQTRATRLDSGNEPMSQLTMSPGDFPLAIHHHAARKSSVKKMLN